VYYLGDYLSYIAGFSYPWITAAGGASIAAADRISYLSKTQDQVTTPASGAMIMRAYTGASGAVVAPFITPNGVPGSVPGCNQAPNVTPSPYLGGNIISHPIMIGSAIGPIGELRGVRYPSQDVNTISGGTLLSGTLPGSMLLLLRNANSYGSTFSQFSGGLLIETALPWQ
jgi:hypothetical protein